MITKVEGTKHLESTGEIYEANSIAQRIDETTMMLSGCELSYDEVVKCRVVTTASIGVSIASGITAGVVLGKGIFTGICIGVATTALVDVSIPYKRLYKLRLKK